VGPRAGLDAWGKSRRPPGFGPWTVRPVAQSLFLVIFFFFNFSLPSPFVFVLRVNFQNRKTVAFF
jgi:hypothetical protein